MRLADYFFGQQTKRKRRKHLRGKSNNLNWTSEFRHLSSPNFVPVCILLLLETKRATHRRQIDQKKKKQSKEKQFQFYFTSAQVVQEWAIN